MNEQENINLAKWSRDYLAMKTPLNQLISMASLGDNIAQAALTLLSNVEFGIVNGDYFNVSSKRAVKILENGITPPYSIRCKETVEENNSTHILQTVISIDKSYSTKHEIVQKNETPDILDEFLIN